MIGSEPQENSAERAVELTLRDVRCVAILLQRQASGSYAELEVVVAPVSSLVPRRRVIEHFAKMRLFLKATS